MEDLVFDSLELRELNVEIGGKKYVLREANGEAAIAYENARMAGAQFNTDNKVSTNKSIADTYPLLVHYCLYTVEFEPDGTFGPRHNQRVPIDTIKSWPSHIQRKLFEAAKKLSEMDEPETVEELEKIIAEYQKRLISVKSKGDRVKN